jgi:hypothetical protein
MNAPGALKRILGADWRRFVPTADVDRDDVYTFLDHDPSWETVAP